MSTSYQMTYTVYINGAPHLLAQIPAVAQAVVEDYNAQAEKVFWDQSPAYRETAQLFCHAAEQALEAGETVCRLEQEEGDDRHGVMDAFLSALDTRLPQLALAILAIYLDAEYTHSRLSNFLYSPAGSSSLHLKDFYGYESRCDVLPNESWIPYSWRHFTPFGPPFAYADGSITLLGPWGEEKTMVEQALTSDGLLEALHAFPYMKKTGDLIWKTETGYDFAMCSSIALTKVGANPDCFLSPYFHAHEASYRALCAAMREKRCFLHLEISEVSHLDRQWNRTSKGVWHFLLYSDGVRLRALFPWNRIIVFSYWGSCSEPLIHGIYHALTGYAFSDLDQPEQYLVRLSLEDAVRAYDPFGMPMEQLNWSAGQVEEAAASFVEAHRDAFLPLVEPFLPEAPEPFTPAPSDRRFAGKKFMLKGMWKGAPLEEWKPTVEVFGGKVAQRMAADLDYVVCGNHAGEPFRNAQKRGRPLLPAPYLEDMMQ